MSRGDPRGDRDDRRRATARRARRGARRLDVGRLGVVGLAAQDTLDAMEQGVSLAQGPSSYVYPRPAAHSRLGDRDRARRDAAALPRGRASTSSPAAGGAGSDRARVPQLPQPARLLGLGRRDLPRLRGARLLGQRRRPPSLTASPGRGERCSRSSCLAGPAGSSRAAGSCRGGRSGRRSGSRATAAPARARRRRPPGRRDEPVRARLPPPVAPRLALAAAGADSPPGVARGCPPRGLRSARLPRLVVRHALRARLGRAVVLVELFAVGYAPRRVRDRCSPGSRRRDSCSRSLRPLRAVPGAAERPRRGPRARADPHARLAPRRRAGLTEARRAVNQ